MTLARQLAALGHRVLLASREVSEAREVAKNFPDPTQVEPCRLDLLDSKSISRCVAKVEKEFGRLDILVNNAGVMPSGSGEKYADSLQEAPEENLRKVLEVNFFGTLRVTRAMLSLLRKSREGRIVNVSSGMGQLSESSASTP